MIPRPPLQRGCNAFHSLGNAPMQSARLEGGWVRRRERRNTARFSSPGSRSTGARHYARERPRSSLRCQMQHWLLLSQPLRPIVAEELEGAPASSQAGAVCCPGRAGRAARLLTRIRRVTSELANYKRCALPPRQNGFRQPRVNWSATPDPKP